jgi:hypothetical protein
MPGPSARFARQKRIPEHFERAGIFLAAGAAEGINSGPDLDEARIFRYLLPACTRQATGDSGGP